MQNASQQALGWQDFAIEVVPRSRVGGLLPRIGALRVQAWESAGYHLDGAADGQWLDEFDSTATHVAVWDGLELVGAARISFHSPGTPLPDGVSYLFAPSVAAVASLTRLVLARPARGVGVAALLDQIRLAIAKQVGAHAAIAHADKHRHAGLIRAGFKPVGTVDRTYIQPSARETLFVRDNL